MNQQRVDRSIRDIAILIVALVAISSCAVAQRLSPFQTCLAQGSFVSIDIPPITLTPSKTAAERQLIGEDRDIEEDGWLVASSSSVRRIEGSTNLQSAREVYRELAVIEYYEGLVRSYKSRGILGESKQKRLAIVPQSKASADEKAAAENVAKEVNLSRGRLITIVDAIPESERTAELTNVQSFFNSDFRERARPGEYVQDDSGTWKIVR